MRMRPLGLMSLAVLAASFAPATRAGDLPAPTETVRILDAKAAGDLVVSVRGAGETHVKFSLQNKTSRRLNVVVPPGLVAAASSGQGFQSMGLGAVNTTPGSFGAFRDAFGGEAGFRSLPAEAPPVQGIGVSPDQTVEFLVPSVCLNYGIATPNAKNVFTLMDVADYSPDPRVQKALRSLATLGTAQPVAQAIMWNLCNNRTFEQLATQTVVPFNGYELAQAARFVEVLDNASGDLVEPAYLQEGRILVRVHGEGPMAKDAARLATGLQSGRLLGLPVRVVEDLVDLPARPGTIVFNVALIGTKPGLTTARVTARSASAFGEWHPLAQFVAGWDASSDRLDGDEFATGLDRAIARQFVGVATARRSPGTTTFRITNRLPMTITNATLRVGKAGDLVTKDALGVGPGRSVQTSVPAASAGIDRVEVNGL